MSFLKYIDLIGPTPQLYVDNNKTNKTLLGGLFSIVLMIMSILCAIGFGLDLIERKLPDIATSKQINMSSKINGKDVHYLLAPQFIGGTEIPEIERKLTFIAQLADTDNNRT